MSENISVTIKDGVEYEGHGVPAGQGVGKVVPIGSNSRESETMRVGFDPNHDIQVDTSRTVRMSGNIPSAVGDGELATIRSEFDQPVHDSAEVTPKCSIEIAGKRMTIATALQLGWLKKIGGEYKVTYQEAMEKAQADNAKADQNVQTVDFTSEHGNAQIKAMAERSSQDSVNNLFLQVLGNMVDGTACDSVIATFSQSIGADPNSVAEVMTEVINDQFNSALEFAEKRYGIDADKMIEWLQETADKHTKRNLFNAMYFNDLKTLEYIVKKYKNKEVI